MFPSLPLLVGVLICLSVSFFTSGHIHLCIQNLYIFISYEYSFHIALQISLVLSFPLQHCCKFAIVCYFQTQVVEEDLLLKINEIREKLEKAEDVEEADLLEKERVIMERRAARMKVK